MSGPPPPVGTASRKHLQVAGCKKRPTNDELTMVVPLPPRLATLLWPTQSHHHLKPSHHHSKPFYLPNKHQPNKLHYLHPNKLHHLHLNNLQYLRPNKSNIAAVPINLPVTLSFPVPLLSQAQPPPPKQAHQPLTKQAQPLLPEQAHQPLPKQAHQPLPKQAQPPPPEQAHQPLPKQAHQPLPEQVQLPPPGQAQPPPPKQDDFDPPLPEKLSESPDNGNNDDNGVEEQHVFVPSAGQVHAKVPNVTLSEIRDGILSQGILSSYMGDIVEFLGWVRGNHPTWFTPHGQLQYNIAVAPLPVGKSLQVEMPFLH